MSMRFVSKSGANDAISIGSERQIESGSSGTPAVKSSGEDVPVALEYGTM